MVAPDLSIVIVNWNTLALTRECLASVFAGLGGLTVEVIVIDNASTDGSAEMIAADFPDCVLIRNATNRGFAAANNQGFAVARGRHVLLLNTDTLIHGRVLPDSVAWMDAHPEAGGMGCRVLNTDGTVQQTCSMYPSLLNLTLQLSGLSALPWPAFFGRYYMRGWARDSERPVEVVTGCYLMVRREVIETVGGLDEGFFFYAEETDWCRRIRDAGWALVFTPVGEITHHYHGSTRPSDPWRGAMLSRAMVRLHRKHGGWPGGAAAFALMFGYNASRALAWSLAAALTRSERARARGRYFRGVVAASSSPTPASR